VRQPQVLEKSHTQEEYIRGRMTRNPYSMKDIGQTMRDVKNKICVDLELAGLLEDDFSMELLVADKIVKLDLDINGVFEQVRNMDLGI
jgi:E3 ubiquitin-protein ligase UBR4